ncbi:MAG: hypothetical protein EOP06_02835 [Proteobacteria bacterium]|nr:MAG: hypothetical protein EOP06_02835 [Pseudomonadota bacterium]
MQQFNEQEWADFAHETMTEDKFTFDPSLCLEFAAAMAKVYSKFGEIESVLWAGASPDGSEDRTWIRTFVCKKGLGYEGMLTSFDGYHATRISEAFISVGVFNS